MSLATAFEQYEIYQIHPSIWHVRLRRPLCQQRERLMCKDSYYCMQHHIAPMNSRRLVANIALMSIIATSMLAVDPLLSAGVVSDG